MLKMSDYYHILYINHLSSFIRINTNTLDFALFLLLGFLSSMG